MTQNEYEFFGVRGVGSASEISAGPLGKRKDNVIMKYYRENSQLVFKKAKILVFLVVNLYNTIEIYKSLAANSNVHSVLSPPITIISTY